MNKHPRQLLHLVLPALAVGIFCMAIWILAREAHAISWQDIAAEFKSLSPAVLLSSGLLALASYGVLTLYDFLALGYVGASLRYLRVAPVSFSAFAIGHNVGLSSLSGGAIRYRAYSLAGLSTSRIALVVGFIPLTFGLGASILLGVTLLADPAALKVVPLSPAVLRPLGGILLALPLLYLAWNSLRRTPLEFRGWVLRAPGAGIGLGQCLLGSVDLALASSVLYVLLHASADIHFLPFLGAYLLAMLAGVISNVPGGVGVFESAMLLLLPEIPVGVLLGAILAYRLFYYLIPLALALVLVVAHEVVEHRAKLQHLSTRGIAWGTRMVPQSVGAAVFFVGAYLLIGAAIPLTRLEQGVFTSFVPVPLLEMAHLLSSAIGVGLLLLARGLYRRLQGAYRATVILLAVGSILMFIHRESMAQTALLLLVLLLTWLSRAEFYRGRGLLDQRFD
ncbi:MAG: lysylphosphatidylglycerol synthase domain-containing protein, partial [Gammaproteobacteria bacterium]|nr:lysylphosphatidylglycerol synthase domain-containing protein [Gammaproteobacteria bacterium]